MTREDDDDELYDCLEDRLDALLDVDSDDALGSCDECGVDLHEGDDVLNGLCDQCSWRRERGL